MLIQTEAKIYLENQRGHSWSEGFRSFHTFNSGRYRQEGKEPFRSLLALDDQVLLPEVSCIIDVEEPAETVLIPLIGGIEFVDGLKGANYINSGESFHFFAKPEDQYQVTNPYPEASVNYLQIRFRSNALKSDEAYSGQILHSIFDISQKNALLPAFYTFNRRSSAFIGKYGGREEGFYNIQNPENGIFAFVLEGAFEVQNRLLEKRDGLSLLNVETVDFEALSNDAIILVMEVE